MDIEESISKAGFWILGGGGTAMVLLGWKMSKGFGAVMPLWQVIATIVVIWLAALWFSSD